jgi:hypothetical protein
MVLLIKLVVVEVVVVVVVVEVEVAAVALVESFLVHATLDYSQDHVDFFVKKVVMILMIKIIMTMILKKINAIVC